MVQNIAVPAEVVRQIATDASERIHMHRDAGRKNTARRLEQHISEALTVVQGKDGEFVSISPVVVSALTADAGFNQYSEAAQLFLEQYDFW